MPDQVAAVKRALVGSLNKAAIDHAVESYGYSRETLEEILVLCGGETDEMSRRWNAFNRTPEQRAQDADPRSQFELEQFLAYVRDEVAKEKQQSHAKTKRKPKRKPQRKRGRRR